MDARLAACGRPGMSIYRRRMPPSVPRTIARPTVLPIEPPIDLPMSAGDLAGDPVGHRAGDFARDQLAGRQALAARAVGAEDRAEHVADAAEHAAALLRRAFGCAGCVVRLPGPAFAPAAAVSLVRCVSIS